jgi:hypothetical protein
VSKSRRGRHGCDLIVVGFTTTYAISAYHHWSCEFESRSDEMYSIQHYVIKVWQWLAKGWWFSPGTPVSSSNKTDHHNIAEILLKVALNTTTLTPKSRERMILLWNIGVVWYKLSWTLLQTVDPIHKTDLFYIYSVTCLSQCQKD